LHTTGRSGAGGGGKKKKRHDPNLANNDPCRGGQGGKMWVALGSRTSEGEGGVTAAPGGKVVRFMKTRKKERGGLPRDRKKRACVSKALERFLFVGEGETNGPGAGRLGWGQEAPGRSRGQQRRRDKKHDQLRGELNQKAGSKETQ